VTSATRNGEMHVLCVIDSLVPAGAEQSLAATAPHLIEAGLHLDVAYLRDQQGLQEELRNAGAKLFCLGERGRRANVGSVKQLIARRAPDLVHTTLFEADVAGRTAARLSRVPVVSSIVSDIYSPRHFGDPKIARWRLLAARSADRATGRFVVRWHSVAGYLADQLAPRLAIPRDRIDVVHRGRDERRLGRRSLERRANARASLGIDHATPLVLAAARHEYQKGLDVLIEAWPGVKQRVDNAQLLIAGREGNQTPELKSVMTRSGSGSIALLGERRDVSDLMCAADVIVMPSRWEGLPGVMLETMALETPLVVTDMPSVREIAGDQDIASIVSVGASRQLADALVDALVDGKSSAARAARARIRFEESFTIEAASAAMIDFYRRALKAARREPQLREAVGD
jgi:glycosyltransferase involved in cell wall biosynthesis